MLNAVQMDPDARRAFLAMPREEQLLAILGMQAWARDELSKLSKKVINVERRLGVIEKPRSYREEDDEMTITQKVMNILTKRLDFWLGILKSVLTQVFTIITLAILYLAFGGKLP